MALCYDRLREEGTFRHKPDSSVRARSKGTHARCTFGVLSNPWVVAGIGAMVVRQLLLTYVPAMNRFLMTEPIDLAAWGRILAAGLVGFLIIEFEKWLRRRTANAQHRSHSS